MDVGQIAAALHRRRETILRGTPPQYRHYALNADLIQSVALSDEVPFWMNAMDRASRTAVNQVLALLRGESAERPRPAAPAPSGPEFHDHSRSGNSQANDQAGNGHAGGHASGHASTNGRSPQHGGERTPAGRGRRGRRGRLGKRGGPDERR